MYRKIIVYFLGYVHIILKFPYEKISLSYKTDFEEVPGGISLFSVGVFFPLIMDIWKSNEQLFVNFLAPTPRHIVGIVFFLLNSIDFNCFSQAHND